MKGISYVLFTLMLTASIVSGQPPNGGPDALNNSAMEMDREQPEVPREMPEMPQEDPGILQEERIPPEPSPRSMEDVKDTDIPEIQNDEQPSLDLDLKEDMPLAPVEEEKIEEEKPPAKDEEKDRDRDNGKQDRDRKHKDRDHDRNSFHLGISFGFPESSFYLPPPERVVILYPVVEVVPDVAIFIEKVSVVEPACLFPEDGFYTILIPIDSVFKNIVAKIKGESELCDLLEHFIIPELIILDNIRDQETFVTLAGTEIVVTRKGDDFFIGDVKITKPVAYKEKGIVVHVLEGDIR